MAGKDVGARSERFEDQTNGAGDPKPPRDLDRIREILVGRERAELRALRERLEPRSEWQEPGLAWLLELEEDGWQEATRHTAVRRARRRMLVRNAIVAAGNAGDASLVPALERHARGDDAMLAEHASWALEQLGAT